jgi:hypothetical protein
MDINKWTHRPIITTALIICSLLTFSQSSIADEAVTVTPSGHPQAEAINVAGWHCYYSQ